MTRGELLKLALSEETDVETLIELAKSDDALIRKVVASNNKTPNSTLCKLCDDADYSVSSMANDKLWERIYKDRRMVAPKKLSDGLHKRVMVESYDITPMVTVNGISFLGYASMTLTTEQKEPLANNFQKRYEEAKQRVSKKG